MHKRYVKRRLEVFKNILQKRVLCDSLLLAYFWRLRCTGPLILSKKTQVVLNKSRIYGYVADVVTKLGFKVKPVILVAVFVSVLSHFTV